MTGDRCSCADSVGQTHPQVEGWVFVYWQTQYEQWTGKSCKPFIALFFETRSASKDPWQQVIPSGHLSISLPSTMLPKFFCRLSAMEGGGGGRDVLPKHWKPYLHPHGAKAKYSKTSLIRLQLVRISAAP
jgi:hypothetical protein